MQYVNMNSARRVLMLALAASFVAAAHPPKANAFGIGDVFGAVEDVWDAADDLGSAIGNKVRNVGRGTITPTGPKRRTTSGTRRDSNSKSPPPRRIRTSGQHSDSRLPPNRRRSERVSVPSRHRPICNSKFQSC